MPGGVSMARHTARREGLDDYHGSTTTRTGMRRLLARCGSFLVAQHLRRWRCGSNQLAGACQRLSLGAAARQQAVVADAVKALRQDMQDEAPDELGGRQRHGLVAARAFDSIVLVTERDASLVGLDQPAVGDGEAMGVARKVGQNLLWSGEWRLGVDVPAGVIERFEEGLEW